MASAKTRERLAGSGGEFDIARKAALALGLANC